MEGMKSSEVANNCVICSVPIDFIQDGSSSPPSEVKLANTFIQCLTLDSDYLEDLTSSPFCLKCKLNLEEWDFCQNQMVRFVTRSRQLKASLIAKLLESPWQPVADIRSKPNQRFKLLRQSVKRRFDPRVVLEKAYPADFSCFEVQKKTDHSSSKTALLITVVSPGKFLYRGRTPFSHVSGCLQCGLCAFNCEDGGRGRAAIVSHMKLHHYSETATDDVTAELSQCIQPPENHAENGNSANFVQVKLEELNDCTFSEDFGMQSSPVPVDENPLEINEDQQSTTQGPVKEYVHAGIQVTVVNGKHICGLCHKYFDGKYPRKGVVEHIRRCHRILRVNSQHKQPLAVTNNAVVECSKGQEESDLESSSPLAQNYILNSIPLPELKKAAPTFVSQLIKEVKPGEYLYRDKIPFYYKNKHFTCGRCRTDITRRDNMYKHLRRCDERQGPRGADDKLPLPQPDFEAPPKKETVTLPAFKSDLIRQVKPGEYLYRDRIHFRYQDKRFTCGQCKTVISRRDNMYTHLRRCEARQGRGGADDILLLPQSSFEAPPKKKTATFPTFKSNLIRHVKPGEYLYRGKIPFYYKDERFTCGRCKAVISSAKRHWATSNMWKHLVRCEKREISGRTTPPPPSPPPEPSGIQQVESPLPPEAGSTTPFSFQCYGVPIALKNNLYHCGVCQRTFATFPDVEEHILHTPGHKAQDISALNEPTAAATKSQYNCNVCGLQFHGSDSRIQYKDHMTSAHAPPSKRIRPAPPLIPVHNTNKQSRLLDLPVSFLLPTRRQPTDTENNGSPEMQAPVVETEDAALIVPDIVGDPFDDVDQRVDYSRNGETDPLDLMKIDFDCLEAEMDVTEELLGS